MKLNVCLLGFWLMLLAGLSWAQDMPIKKKLFMPGDVIEGHAKFEKQCEKCHSPYDDQAMHERCIDCHKEIREDRQAKKGFHGQAPTASTQACTTCHTDHLGRKANIIPMQVETFSHQWTRFPLEAKHAALACTDCHQEGKKFREAEPTCVSCHKDDDFHKGALGKDCQDCHKPVGWRKIETFDHSKTDFPLKGLHQEVACNSCHLGQNYTFEKATCVTCHKAADQHAGKNGDQCDKCHTVDGWKKLSFDHTKTKFPLTFQHQTLPCRACHANGIAEKNTSSTCYSCHKTTDVHLGKHGQDCQTCHTPQAWSKTKFEHAQKTTFPLIGQHSELACGRCHTQNLDVKLATQCVSCHQADDIHKNPEMQTCSQCHTPKTWQKVDRFDHNFTPFPLIGMHLTVPCQHCHSGNQFAGTSGQCVDCHQNVDPHNNSLSKQCQTCHTPNSWKLWQFDHKKRTGFDLQGSHSDLACKACHQPNTRPDNTPKVCGQCHQADDIHKGSFGNDCGRCHKPTQFNDLNLKD